MKREDVAEYAWGSVKLNKCVRACVCTLAHVNEYSVFDVFRKLIYHMFSNCVDGPHTTHRAAGSWRPAEPGPSQQNPRTAHRNHIHQSPDGLLTGLIRELIPAQSITFFKNKVNSQEWTVQEQINRRSKLKIIKILRLLYYNDLIIQNYIVFMPQSALVQDSTLKVTFSQFLPVGTHKIHSQMLKFNTETNTSNNCCRPPTSNMLL